MPIILNTEPDRVETLRIGDSEIHHTRASGDEVQAALEATADPETGRFDHTEAAKALMLKHVKGWANVLDANRVEVPFSEDVLEMFHGALGYNERLRIDAAITASYVEAVEGKDDSATGSSGTD